MLGIIDAGNWQSLIDMKTGKPLEMQGDNFSGIRALAKNFPYPGDLSDDSIDWVSGAAQTVVNMHNPDWMLLTYVQPYFMEMFLPEDSIKSQQRQKHILDDIGEFSARNNFETLIVATSEYVPLKGFITQPDTKGTLESWPWGFSMAGISAASAADEKVLWAHPHIKHVIAKAAILEAHPDLHPDFIDYFPDYVVVAEEGYAFRGINYHHGKIYMADTFEATLPVYSTIGQPQHVRDIRRLMEQALNSKKKVLMAVIEGFRKGSLPEPFKECNNMDEWYSYRGMQLYHVLHTGIPFYKTDSPPIFNRSKKHANTDYPLSGFSNSNQADSIASKEGIRSAAVSSRGMVAQTVTNADIMLESYCRDLSSMGVLAVFKPEKL